MRRKLGLGTAVLFLVLILVGVRSLEAPLVLYPASASLPAGPYLRSFEKVDTGKIVAFAVPDAARHYQIKRGENVPPDFLFMKPIVAGPGDHVCNRPREGAFVNGTRIAPVATRDRAGRRLPVWRGCRRLSHGEFFTLSTYAPNSFDSRHYGPIQTSRMIGTYRPITKLWGGARKPTT